MGIIYAAPQDALSVGAGGYVDYTLWGWTFAGWETVSLGKPPIHSTRIEDERTTKGEGR